MRYSPILQQVLTYIEQNLHDSLDSERVARKFGYSKYHFARIFKQEVGVNLAEYVRLRRISLAASMLLHTDERVLDIAYYFQFQSQEAFTRAFKELYHMPPGQYRKVMANIVCQKEEGNVEKREEVKGWFLTGSHPYNYEMGIDSKIFHSGKASGYLKSVSVQDQTEFATMMQECKADLFKGKRVKLTGFIKSANVNAHCAMWMRVDNALQDTLQFDNMHDRPIKGNTEWNRYSIVLDVPESSAMVAYGFLLIGTGTVWADNFQFEVVDEKVPTTNMSIKGQLLDEPMNLSFEE